MRISTEGDTESCRSPSPRFHQNRLTPLTRLFHTSIHCKSQRKRSSSSCVFFFLETSPNCAVASLPPPSVRPGASSGLRPTLRSLAGNQEERGKSDTLAALGVCQSVKCVRGESPQRSAHTPFPRKKKHPLDNEILTYALSLRLSTWTLDEFPRN